MKVKATENGKVTVEEYGFWRAIDPKEAMLLAADLADAAMSASTFVHDNLVRADKLPGSVHVVDQNGSPLSDEQIRALPANTKLTVERYRDKSDR